MNKPDLDSMSTEDLETLAKEVQERLQAQRTLQKQEAIREIKEKITQYGITSEELGLSSSIKASTSKRSKQDPTTFKYRTPDRTPWSGKGRDPKWLIAMEGYTKDDFLIDPETNKTKYELNQERNGGAKETDLNRYQKMQPGASQ